MRFAGKVATVTGGTSGLGAAVVRALRSEGALVAACGLHPPADPVPGVLYTCHDVRSDDDMAAFVAGAEQAFGPPTLGVFCAGINHPPARAGDLAPALVADILATNVAGLFNALRHQVGPMIAAGGGAIVTIASTLSGQGAGWMSAYGTSKHAVVGLTLSAALDYADDKIRFNAVSPGPMDTPMFARALHDIGGDWSKYAGGLPPEGPAQPETVAQTILFLLSDAAEGINGANLFVDQARQAGA